MNNPPKQLILVGGGTSISEALSKGLWDKLKGKFTFGLNYSFNYFDSTLLCYVDSLFYEEETKKLKSLPLIVGKRHKQMKFLPNTIPLKCNDSTYNRDLKRGVFKSALAGLFALSLGIHVLEEGEIYLLGFDNKADGRDEKGRPRTHFYQGEINHGGIGKISYYNGTCYGKPTADKNFGVYKDLENIKIFNVSLISRIGVFPKISYEEFFKRLKKNTYDQDELRKWVRIKLGGLD